MRNLALGQVAEWLVWTQLVAGSGADLHVFLPLRDEGIDGIVHRLSTDEYAPVQVKGAHRLGPSIQIQVKAHELADDHAQVVAVETDVGLVKLGPDALVIGASVFRQQASSDVHQGSVRYFATIQLPPESNSRWARWCLPLDEIGERLLPRRGERMVGVADTAVRGDWETAGRLGFRAEMELLRRAAQQDRLNIFKAFPDLEPNEYLMYDLESRGVVGIQVKAAHLPTHRTGTRVQVYRPALRPSPKTWFVVFLEDEGEAHFHENCAVVPSLFVAEHLAGSGKTATFGINRDVRGRLAPWRVPLDDLGARLAELASSLA